MCCGIGRRTSQSSAQPEDDLTWEIIQSRHKGEAAIDVDPDSNAERTPTLLYMRHRNKRGKQSTGHNGPTKFNASGSREKFTLLAIGGPTDKNDLVVDSGASAHIFGEREFFDNLDPVMESKVVLADRREISCTHEGTVSFQVVTDVGVRKLGLSRVKYSSELTGNYVSLMQPTEKGCRVTFDRKGGRVDDKTGGMLARIVNSKRGYILDRDITLEEHVCHFLSDAHFHTGHTEDQTAKRTLDAGAKCLTCLRTKMKRKPRRGRLMHALEVADITNSDVCGALPLSGTGNFSQFVTFTDEKSRHLRVFPIVKKSDVEDTFLDYCNWFQRKTGRFVKVLHCDNGGEFEKLKPLLRKIGVEWDPAPPHSPECNGIAELVNSTILQLMRSMLCDAGASHASWPHTVQLVERIINSRTRRGQSASPVEIAFWERDTLNNLYPFGCRVIGYVPAAKRNKLDVVTKEYILLKCFENGNFEVRDVGSVRDFVMRDVAVVADEFPLLRKKEGNYGYMAHNEISHAPYIPNFLFYFPA
ncbi:hypothetical protein NDN08_006650 [Rhodosorus marinus]|uniref:Integrase catalytic domain-containing protein n=1 Tax=Rhodosorus marinus TaxID=101924 RepID=A0AAV8UMC1_9RHOD|nr:hypothetical protein NDN08_006650 [Rhodosorus marinus]